MKHPADSVAEYLAALPAERRTALETLRQLILSNMDPLLHEGIQYGMIGYSIPHSVYPAGYHCDPDQPVPFASIASQKNHMALYLFCVYGNPAEEAWVRGAWKRAGKKLDMGKSCIRFKKLEDLPLDAVAELIRRAKVRPFLEHYETVIADTGSKRRTGPKRRKTTAKRSVKKSTAKAAKKAARQRVPKAVKKSAVKAAQRPARKAAKRSR